MAKSASDPLRVEAGADKELFVSMLVKDIELLPAIMDLIDNSVDGARATTPGDPSQHWVRIETGVDGFTISDNCGGIDLDTARKHAFRFGRPKDHAGVEGSVGQFGVGMKRALFKLGRQFSVSSRSAKNAFELQVDVDDWLADKSSEWQFRMTSIDTNYSGDEGTGTIIRVTRLHEYVQEDLKNRLVLGSLREQIRLRHQASLEQGLSISLNGEKLRGLNPKLMSGPGFTPINKRIIVTTNEGQVHCHIVAGIAEASKNDDIKDEGQAEGFRTSGDAGWWVFCNGRLLLFAERTELTGWGTAVAAYHPQYRRFRGYVYLESLDSSLLPWNTTKTGVDQDSRVWRRVQSEVKTSLVEVVSVINRLKTERASSLSPEYAPVTAALEGARSVPLSELTSSVSFQVPALPRRKPAPPKLKHIQYDVSPQQFIDVARALGVSTATSVGRQTFEYFYEREVDAE